MEVVLAAGAVITDDEGRVLLVRRRHAPQRGRWSVPGGRVEAGETLLQAAAREALEETGVRVAIGRELWAVHVPAGDGRVYEVHDFAARPVGGALAPGDDATDARWVGPGALSRLRTTTHLVSHLRGAGIAPSLPRVDEHSVVIGADAADVHAALEEGLRFAGGARIARALGCDDIEASGPRPLAVGSTVPGFRVVAADPPTRLELAGRHRYAEYELEFRIERVDRERTRLRAVTRAVFPGPHGAVYRGLLLGAGLHARATRGILARVRRAAEAVRSNDHGPG
ncbi:NUDIX hydrolase [Agromyces arachidis]|uniref:NUDIX hydrolase n=1 Tax=Agromyces arachidis TaxID=766966 RepID=UPI004056BCC8